MPPAQVRAYIVRRREIEAEEQIARAIVGVFSYPAESQDDLDYRNSLLDEWAAIAKGIDPREALGDYYQRGSTIYVRTAEAYRRALRVSFQSERERELFAVETPEGE